MVFKRAALRRVKRRRTFKSKPSRMFVKRVKRVINSEQEKKFLLTNSSGTISWTGGCTVLTNVPQGDTDSQRDGDQVYSRSLEIRCNLQIGTNTSNLITLIVFQWFPTTVPTTVGVLFPSAVSSGSAPLSPYNHDYRTQFKILARRSVNLIGAAASNPDYQKQIVFWIKSGFRRKIQFLAGSTAANNHIYLLTISDSTTATLPSIAYIAKYNYSDM